MASSIFHYPIAPFVYKEEDKVPKDVTSIIIDPSVTTINAYACINCKNLTSVTIPDSVVSIGDYAFYDCINLRSIIFPDNLKEIGNAAFDGCTSLTTVLLPESISKIRYRAFYRCTNLIAVFLPQFSIKSIRNNAFSDCTNLVLVCVPKSVRKVLYSAFDNCESLKKKEEEEEEEEQRVGREEEEENRNFNSIMSKGEDESEEIDCVEEELDLESWLQIRFDKLPLHELCYFYAALNDDAILSPHKNLNKRASTNNSSHEKEDAITSTEPSQSSIFRTQMQSLIRNNPDMIQSTDKIGMTPLHILSCYCTNKKININISNNDAPKQCNNSSFIPKIMNEMIDLCPSLTEKKNNCGMTPLDLYIECCFRPFCTSPTPTVSLEEKSVMTDTTSDASLYMSNETKNFNYLPLCLLIKMGMGWKDVQKILQVYPSAALEHGLTSPMNRTRILDQYACNENCNTGGDHELSHPKIADECNNTDSDLYPFMQAALKGDLELAYHLALYRIDLLQ